MSREEHLQWAKDRALRYIENEDDSQAVASFTSDMSKHDDLKDHSALPLLTMQFFGGMLKSNDLRTFILDFN